MTIFLICQISQTKTNGMEKTLLGNKWSIYNGSALEVLAEMPAKAVNCVVTSPPYFWLRDYGVEGQIGMEASVSDYVATITEIMSEVRRVLRDDGVAFFNIGDTFYSGKGMSHGQDEKSKKRRFGLRAVDKSGGMGIGLQRKSLIGTPWRLATSLMEYWLGVAERDNLASAQSSSRICIGSSRGEVTNTFSFLRSPEGIILTKRH